MIEGGGCRRGGCLASVGSGQDGKEWNNRIRGGSPLGGWRLFRLV